VTALVLIPLTWQLGTLVGVLILGGFVFFFLLSKAGEKLVLKSLHENDSNNSNSRSNSTCKLSTSSSTNIMINYNNNNNNNNDCNSKADLSPTHGYSNSIDIKD